MRRQAVAALLLLGCAAGGQRALGKLSGERMARAEQLKAAQNAPFAYQAFQKAARKAQEARADSAAHHDHESAARLWLETAIEQAERGQLARQRLQVEEQSARQDEALLAAETERAQLEQQVEREEAANIARTEAERALARAAQAPAQRIKLDPSEVQRAATALLSRAELIALTLPSSLPAVQRNKLDTLLREAHKALPKTADRALDLADRALFEALALLGVLRAQGEPTVEQKASLREALQLAGAQVSRDERGLTARVAQAEARMLQRLCGIARAYPHGPVQVVLARAGKLSKAVTSKLLAEQACVGERFQVVDGEGAAPLAVTFLGY